VVWRSNLYSEQIIPTGFFGLSNVVVEWSRLLLRILEVPDPNLGPETGYPD
jgi:hypothetical protein